MKKGIILLAVIALHHFTVLAQGVNNTGHFILSGKVNGRNTGLIWLSYIDKNGKEVKDTTYLKKGAFAFKGYVSGPISAILLGRTKSRSSDDPNFTELFLEPGKMQIMLSENDFKSFKMTGSNTQTDMTLLRNQKSSVTKKENTIGLMLQELNNRMSKGDTSLLLRSKKDSVWGNYLVCREEERKIDYAFIASHPSSCLSPYLMDYYFGSRKLPLDSAELFFNRFTTSVKESPLGKNINSQIVQRKTSAVGGKAPDFTRADINGAPLTLSSLEGRGYILLDFWASWCVPCRADNPEIKRIYETYHPKGLDIISISWDSDKKAWHDAINKDGTNQWYHVFANVFLPNDNGLRGTYAIAGIPSLILIDKNGTIIGRYRGGSEEGDISDLDKKLAEVFSKQNKH